MNPAAAVSRRRLLAAGIGAGLVPVVYAQHAAQAELAPDLVAAVAAFASRSAIRFLPDKPDTADNVFPFDDALYRALGHAPQISMLQGMQMEAAHRRALQGA